ncbi:hypothetical protein AN191_04550 [Loktanella sp. 5RATIMAR09]|nr:hypothetical protein AN191_04550 [Loktanella sp. 5RATIMAR09]
MALCVDWTTVFNLRDCCVISLHAGALEQCYLHEADVAWLSCNAGSGGGCAEPLLAVPVLR